MNTKSKKTREGLKGIFKIKFCVMSTVLCQLRDFKLIVTRPWHVKCDIHWVPLNEFGCNQHPATSLAGLNCIFLLVVSGTQCSSG